MSNARINGPFVVGYSLCFGLMGALAVQAYIYFTTFTGDRRIIKAFVSAVLLLETLLTGVVFAGFWASSTQEFPLMVPSLLVAKPVVIAPISGLVTTLTHGFFCWRIASLRKFRLLPFPIMMVSLLQLASIIYFGVENKLYPSNESLIASPSSDSTQISTTLSPWLVIWLGSSFVCDLAITVCMILCLRPSNSHFRRNKSTMVKLTRLAVETGLVTTVAAVLELILGLAFQTSYYHIAVFYAISKLYANCLLASLNFRLVLRSQSDPNLTAILWDDGASSIQPDPQLSHVAQILARVESDIHVVADLNEIGLRKNSSSEDQTCEAYELVDKSRQV
ncbi:hypothetical protein HD554DRAFT_514854 [Boletus coccyginus]|nr:hypothetical protein HD554DRAFT_514854 [Boletus coccyginus]